MVEKTHSAGWWPELYQPFRNIGERIADWFAPRSEAKAKSAAYEITLELPGVARDDIDVSLHEGVLTVKGEKRSEKTEEKEGYFFSEREYGRFQRTFRLPADADGESVQAEFTDGVLKISVARRAAAEGARKISVRTG